ncbi:MAG: DUF4912 domain-containing protein [Clostridiaceae bacterium]|nr:DUF4912 domain-containing protein [Clostridiaceae bacterium]
MPRKAKEEEIILDKKIEKKKTTTSKETSSKKNTNNSKKSTSKSTKVGSKSVTSKTSNKKSPVKSTKKVNTKTEKITKKATKKVANKKIEIVEYYDLPYRYNQTVVKVLAQTPTTLFVYWDISDEDKNKYIEQYGEYFFNNTKPVLKVYNITKGYDFEVAINDFSNSWYLSVSDSNCDYKIELARRPINQYVSINNDYLYIASSNEIDSPNDHILFDELSKFVYFKNVKNNKIEKKDITNLFLLKKINKLYSIQNFYKELYPEEAINIDRLDLKNPSSNNPTSSFK